MTAIPQGDRYTKDEQRAPLNVRDLTDTELSILALYRGFLAVNTIPGHPEYDKSVSDLRKCYDEMLARQVCRYSLP